MRTIILTFFAVLILIACNQKVNKPASKKTVITGQVSDFEKVSGHDEVKLLFPDLLTEGKTHRVKIDGKGNFRVEIELKHPTDFRLQYSGMLTYFLFPGDSLHFDISSDCWKIQTQTHGQEAAFYQVSGTSGKMNSDVSLFMIYYNDSLFNQMAYSDSIKKMEAMDFQKYRIKELSRYQDLLERFNLSRNTCKEFRSWAKSYVRYFELSGIIGYNWYHALAINEEVEAFLTKMPVEYSQFLKDLDIRRNDDLNASTCITFLADYVIYTDLKIPADSQKVYFGNKIEQIEPYSKYILRYYSQQESGFFRDVLISKFYYRMLDAKNYAQIKNVFNAQLIEDKELREQVQEKFDYEKNLYENPVLAENSKLNAINGEGNYLQELLEKYPGKVIYIDFWAPWCTPCMNEMPYSEKIKKHFEGKDVVFVYLASRCEETAWKSTIAEKKIEGEHFLLTDKQFDQLSNYFGIKGIPQYALFDKQGKVISKSTLRPSSGDELIHLIEEYLN